MANLHYTPQHQLLVGETPKTALAPLQPLYYSLLTFNLSVQDFDRVI